MAHNFNILKKDMKPQNLHKARTKANAMAAKLHLAVTSKSGNSKHKQSNQKQE
jgi:hypothetical protein